MMIDAKIMQSMLGPGIESMKLLNQIVVSTHAPTRFLVVEEFKLRRQVNNVTLEHRSLDLFICQFQPT